MRSINGAVLRSAFAMVLGFVLVLWPEAAITYLVITIGILFILPGLFETSYQGDSKVASKFSSY